MVILDASVIFKWLVSEEGSDAALRYHDDHVRGEERIIVPSLLFYEIANVVRYNDNVPDDELIQLFDILNDLELSAIHPSFSEFKEAVLYARAKNISVYDASYVILAKRLGCKLATADQRLAKAVNESFVKVLA